MNRELNEFDSYIRNCHIDKTCLSHHALEAQTQMRNDDTLCDACIHLDCGAKIRVHRIIMCAACEYFRYVILITSSTSRSNLYFFAFASALFTSPLNLNQPTDIHMKGVSMPAMQAIIDFAYTRSARITDDNATDIIAVAHYIGLLGLEDVCASHIISMLTPANCVNLWLELRATLYQHDLDAQIKMYILRNFLDVAKRSDQLMRIEFEEFFEIISDDRLNVKAEEPVWECCVKWIDGDVDRRRSHTKALLSVIRLGLMGLNVFMWYLIQ